MTSPDDMQTDVAGWTVSIWREEERRLDFLQIFVMTLECHLLCLMIASQNDLNTSGALS